MEQSTAAVGIGAFQTDYLAHEGATNEVDRVIKEEDEMMEDDKSLKTEITSADPTKMNFYTKEEQKV